MTAWRQITCEEREALVTETGRSYNGFDRDKTGISVISSRSDLDGIHGNPCVDTVWGTDDERPVLRDVRHPALDHEAGKVQPDRLPCEHYVPEDGAA